MLINRVKPFARNTVRLFSSQDDFFKDKEQLIAKVDSAGHQDMEYMYQGRISDR